MTENRGTTTTTTFAQYLQRALDHRAWTKADLARKSGISESNFSRWITGATVPNVDNARRIAEAISRPLLEVVIAAGILSPDEVGQDVELRPDPATLSDDELLGELRQRMKSAAPRPPSREEMADDPNRFGTVGTQRKRRKRSGGSEL